MNTLKNETVAQTTVNGNSKRMGRPRKHYWDINLVMDYIASENLQTLGEYQNWVVEQKHENIFPLNPNAYYKKDYPGVDKFLGNPVGTSKARIKDILTLPENRVKSITARRANAKQRRAEKAKEMQRTLQASKVTKPATTAKTASVIGITYKPDVAQCFKTLLEHNVSFETLYKVNNEMANLTTKEARDITSVLFDFLSKKSKATV